MLLHRLIAITAFAQLSVAHIFLYAVWINGKDMGRGDGKPAAKGTSPSPAYIRAVRNNDPIKNVMSRDMTCNTPGSAAARFLDVRGGDKVVLSTYFCFKFCKCLFVIPSSQWSGITTTEAQGTISWPTHTKAQFRHTLLQPVPMELGRFG
jgi:hypothetical protein